MTPYTSALLADLSDGALVSVYIVGVCAVAGIGAGIVVYGWPPAWQWLKVRASRIQSAFTRWHVAQINKANEPQPHPPSSDTLAWALPLLVILPLVALVVAIIRCNGVGR